MVYVEVGSDKDRLVEYSSLLSSVNEKKNDTSSHAKHYISQVDVLRNVSLNVKVVV